MKVILDDKVRIPRTFDVHRVPQTITTSKLVLGLVIWILILIVSIICFFVFKDYLAVRCFVVALPFIAFGCIRVFYLNEGYFKKHFNNIKEHDFKYDASLFWNIYDTEHIKEFTIFKFPNNRSCILVQMVKGVIIGQGSDNMKRHHDAITLAYRKLARKKITFMHIDYMDTVGRDKRFDQMVNNIQDKCTDEMLSDLLGHIFKFQKNQMLKSLSTYDLYAFYYTGDDYVFIDDIQEVLDAFMKANYIGYEVLDDISAKEVVTSLFNLKEFSVELAKTSIYKTGMSSKHLRLISTVKNGDAKILALTKAQKEEKLRIQRERKAVTSKRLSKKKRLAEDNQVIDIFGDNQESTGKTDKKQK